MTRIRARRSLLWLALVATFCAGVFVDAWLRMYGPPKPVLAPAPPALTEPPVASTSPAIKHPIVQADSPTISAASPPTANAARTWSLRVPIDGISIESFKGGFAETRDGHHPHEAVDIVVPRGTPIHAVDDGTIAKLFFSKAGGTTIYQFDSNGRRCYYYAHLEQYADGLQEGQHVSEGDVIGYVGTSGNAPPDTPHLHFAIFELNADRRWWEGRPLDPYLVFKEKD